MLQIPFGKRQQLFQMFLNVFNFFPAITEIKLTGNSTTNYFSLNALQYWELRRVYLTENVDFSEMYGRLLPEKKKNTTGKYLSDNYSHFTFLKSKLWPFLSIGLSVCVIIIDCKKIYPSIL